MTGRKHVPRRLANGNTQLVKKADNVAEKDAFQNDQKQVAVISEAASTGISLHAGIDFKNKRRRVPTAGFQLPLRASVHVTCAPAHCAFARYPLRPAAT